jgi:hypothetical protein
MIYPRRNPNRRSIHANFCEKDLTFALANATQIDSCPEPAVEESKQPPQYLDDIAEIVQVG